MDGAGSRPLEVLFAALNALLSAAILLLEKVMALLRPR
jgi:hypothetical protein